MHVGDEVLHDPIADALTEVTLPHWVMRKDPRVRCKNYFIVERIEEKPDRKITFDSRPSRVVRNTTEGSTMSVGALVPQLRPALERL